MESGEVIDPERGTPQGGVISPLSATSTCMKCLDEWFEHEVKPRLRAVLAKRFAKYGLRLHPDKP